MSYTDLTDTQRALYRQVFSDVNLPRGPEGDPTPYLDRLREIGGSPADVAAVADVLRNAR